MTYEEEPVSPLDKRYWSLVADIARISSEAVLHKLRAAAEIKYLEMLVEELASAGLEKPLTKEEKSSLESILASFGREDVEQIRKLEKQTRHDVAALVKHLSSRVPGRLSSYVHLGLTSEDVNNIANSVILELLSKRGLAKELAELAKELAEKAKRYACSPILGRTHGQPAVATTFGRELGVHAARISWLAEKISEFRPRGKLGGAVGTLAAHRLAFPSVDWRSFSKKFIESLGLEYEEATKQILPHDKESLLLYGAALACNAVVDLAQDAWLYLSLGYARLLRAAETEIGSSTMPQKVNPVDIEGGEGMLKLASRVFEAMAGKLQVSRLQRDLSDSTVKRFYGESFALAVAGIRRIRSAIRRLEYNRKKAIEDLDRHWETLGEALQVLLRARGEKEAYELVRAKLQGIEISGKEEFSRLVRDLAVADPTLKEKLLELQPSKYLGYACEQAYSLAERAERIAERALSRSAELSELARLVLQEQEKA